MKAKRNALNPNWREVETDFRNAYHVERLYEKGDLLVVNAARASLSTTKNNLDESDTKLINFLCREKHINPFYHWRIAVEWDHIDEMFFFDRHDAAGYDFDKDLGIMTLNVYNDPQTFVDIFGKENCISGSKLLEYGHRGQHWGKLKPVDLPSDSCASWRTVRIQCDIPTARQWFKSKIGADESEESRRYVKSEPSLFVPPLFRKGSENIKQGSSDEPFSEEEHEEITKIYKEALSKSREAYNLLLEKNLCGEQARFILPQAMMTTFIDTISVRTLKRMYRLRAASDAQKEINTLINRVIEVCEIKV